MNIFTNINKIKFNYSEKDKKLFSENQLEDFDTIPKHYLKLKNHCLSEVEIIQSGTHKEWIRCRVNLHVTTSLMRLLYLTESFVDASNNFNIVSAAVHIKAMVEIPFHLAYLVYILTEKNKFEDIRDELKKLTWGIKNPDTGLTQKANLTQKELYKTADKIAKKLFHETPDMINMFEIIYKEANAGGHHNYEGRNLLTGVSKNGIWKIRDRKEWFVFISKNIFQFFLHADSILFISDIFIKAINHYIDQLPDYFSDKLQDI
jgi:hypothetical protein